VIIGTYNNLSTTYNYNNLAIYYLGVKSETFSFEISVTSESVVELLANSICYFEKKYASCIERGHPILTLVNFDLFSHVTYRKTAQKFFRHV
jgi:hypothetical protein